MLTLALSKGRIFEDTLPLLAAAGIEVTEDPEKSRKLILATSNPEVRVVLLTARPARVHHLTIAWLERYQIRWDLLIMRPWGDYDLSRDYKQATIWDLRDYGFDLRLGIEDDRRNVQMLRSENIPCIYFHSGYYD